MKSHYVFKRLTQKLSMVPVRDRHCMSRIYRPSSNSPPTSQSKHDDKDKGLSKSQKLLVDNGIISFSSSPGSFHLLPMGVRSLEKITRLIDKILGSTIECQKIQMPNLTSTSLWKASGRYEQCEEELLHVKDRQMKDYVLSPTNEEAICSLVGSTPISYKHLPLRLYQTTSKFRDEMRPRFGLIRAREFVMTDLYTFDMSPETAKKTFDDVNGAFSRLFNYLEIPWIKVSGDTGMMGGSLSDEYHFISDVGEDHLCICSDCGSGFNQVLLEVNDKIKMVANTNSQSQIAQNKDNTKCSACGSNNFIYKTGIEVAHTFLLGTKYTNTLKTTFTNREGKLNLLHMGCYGIGVTRILGASIESTLSKFENPEIRWSKCIAPFLISIVIPKGGSKEEEISRELVERITSKLCEILPDEVLIDDRKDLTIGRRVPDLKRLGIPFLVIFGKGIKESPQLIELQELNSSGTDKCSNMTEEQIISHFSNFASQIQCKENNLFTQLPSK